MSPVRNQPPSRNASAVAAGFSQYPRLRCPPLAHSSPISPSGSGCPLSGSKMPISTSFMGRPQEWSSSGVPSKSASMRSEEHTSELQSLMRISYAVFCLKKKSKDNTKDNKEQKHNIKSSDQNYTQYDYD